MRILGSILQSGGLGFGKYGERVLDRGKYLLLWNVQPHLFAMSTLTVARSFRYMHVSLWESLLFTWEARRVLMQSLPVLLMMQARCW